MAQAVICSSPSDRAASDPKRKKILWNDAQKIYFKELKRVVSAEMLLNYPYRTIPFTVHTDASDKQLSAVISQNNKPIAFILVILIKPQLNYIKTDK